MSFYKTLLVFIRMNSNLTVFWFRLGDHYIANLDTSNKSNSKYSHTCWHETFVDLMPFVFIMWSKLIWFQINLAKSTLEYVWNYFKSIWSGLQINVNDSIFRSFNLEFPSTYYHIKTPVKLQNRWNCHETIVSIGSRV